MINTTVLKTLREIALLIPALVVVFTFKGFFKALLAKYVGDDTAEQDGFLTLNPLAHIDLQGVLILVVVLVGITLFFSSLLPHGFLLLLLVLFGIRLIIPSPIDESKFRNYRLGGVVTSLADFLASVLLALVTIMLMKGILSAKVQPNILITALELCNAIVDFSVFLGILNLIPLPPFDGGRLIKYLLPTKYDYIFNWLEEYAFFIVLFIFFAPGLSDIFWGALSGSASVVKQFLFSLFF